MLKDSDSTLGLISDRIKAAGADPDVYFRGAVEIVVFGSVAAGFERPDSDIDVLCVGLGEGRLKTHTLDFLAISQSTSQGWRWQQSELAGHISKYGVWLQGRRSGQFMGVSEECINEKRRRVSAFMRRLPVVWDELHPDFKAKYSIKVRREVQRLMLLESHLAVPPTRVLDGVPTHAPERSVVCDRLRRVAGNLPGTFCNAFFEMVIREWNKALRPCRQRSSDR